jgi:hypothetical protein
MVVSSVYAGSIIAEGQCSCGVRAEMPAQAASSRNYFPQQALLHLTIVCVGVFFQAISGANVARPKPPGFGDINASLQANQGALLR